MTITKKFTLRDATSPTTSVILYFINKFTVRPEIQSKDTEYVLEDGSMAVDYGTEKRRYNFEIEIEAGKETPWTSANLTDLKTLYALRTTQTIQLVDTWKESSEVVTVHFRKLITGQSESGNDKYSLTLLEA